MIDTAAVHACGESLNTAVIILFHGSKAEGSGEIVQRILSGVRRNSRYEIVEGAFLRYSQPGFMEVVQSCIQQNVRKIVVVPFFLQMGMHVTADIPLLIGKVKKKYPELQITATEAVGSHPRMVDIILDLAEEKKKSAGDTA